MSASLGPPKVRWGGPGVISDLNNHGMIDGADLGLMLNSWSARR
ncbi:MAG TPA: hypothetical protein PKC43_07440 [Phycisphaerales bacterium]|nr:hypothetical protein [Phycisphaerales bacterium]HMP37268.1 hypothetical protein [Phycisphaerales bacterium]